METKKVMADEQLIECLRQLSEINRVVDMKIKELEGRCSDTELNDKTDFFKAYIGMDRYLCHLIVEKLRQNLEMY